MPPAPLDFAHATADGPARVLVVAELGVNHDGDVAKAHRLVRDAAQAGADAVKLQLFRPERLLSNQALLAGYQTRVASDAYDLLAKLVLPLDAVRELGQASREAGVGFIVTPFSPDDADDARMLPLDAVKIASPDAVNPALLTAAAELGLPMIVSTGTCEADELEPLAALLRAHPPGGALLQCVSSYPTPDDDAALGGIAALRERFGLPTGYSDHTTGLDTGALAVAAGAVILEKHLTHDPTAPGPDHAASLGPDDFAAYTRAARRAAAMLGPIAKRVLPVEADVWKVSRQSLCATRDLPAGHALAAADLTVKRPGTGLPAQAWTRVLGRRLARPVRANDLLQPADLAP